MKEIVLISNGIASLKKENGALIDSFPSVVRFNLAKMSTRHSPYIGKKTTHWVFSNYAARVFPVKFSVCSDVFQRCEKLVIPIHEAELSKSLPSGTERMPAKVEELCREAIGCKRGTWATTGAIYLFSILNNYDQIHAHGWYAESDNFNEHYFEQSRSAFSNHDVVAEAAWFRALVDSGKVVEI